MTVLFDHLFLLSFCFSLHTLATALSGFHSFAWHIDAYCTRCLLVIGTAKTKWHGWSLGKKAWMYVYARHDLRMHLSYALATVLLEARIYVFDETEAGAVQCSIRYGSRLPL